MMTVSRERQLLLLGIVIHAISVEVLVVLPAFVHGLVEHMGFSDAQGGRISALENGGMAVSTLAMTYFWNRVPWRTVCFVGLGMVAAANLWSIWATDYFAMLAARFCSGLGTGGLLVLSYAIVGLTERRERNFGLLIATSLVYGALLFTALPVALETWGIAGALILFAVPAILALPLARYCPDVRTTAMAPERGGLNVGLKASALAGVAFYAVAIGALWTYFFRIGAAAGLSETFMSRSFAVSQFCALGGSIAFAALGQRLKLPLALTVGVGGLSLPLLGLLGAPSATRFAVIIALFNFFWNFFHPSLLAALALFGKNSRMLVYASPLLTAGLSFGPALAAATVGGRDFTVTIAGGMAFLFLSLACILPPTVYEGQVRRLAEA
jgi:hypothetical protein